ncbi:MAG: sensor histidine kinase, partial [Oscillospiraceae bacterium]
NVMVDDGSCYTQVTAANVTELYRRQNELQQDNKRLKEYARRIRRLSEDILTLIREEETLTMKMRVHDDIGRSVIATRKFLQQNRPMSELDLTVWKNAVRLLKHENELSEERSGAAKLLKAAESIGIRIIVRGEFPKNSVVSECLLSAVRECMTNAVRHAAADELYVEVEYVGDNVCAVISNNGTVPENEVAEGGGLSSLRVSIENKGGTMKVKSFPRFELYVSVPISPEEKL